MSEDGVIEVELTELEVAKIGHNQEKTNSLTQQIQKAQQKLQKTQRKQKELLASISTRVDVEKLPPPEAWDFSQVSFNEYKGKVLIPIEKVDD